jgi:DNA-binding winged helix-turn-helix (wHTH) protein/TolB-like protein
MGSTVGQAYEFGPFRLEPDEHRLLREGEPAPLTPKAFDLLVFLVRNQGRLVTKDQIMEAVWPGSFVEDANITVLISSLRKVLGEAETDGPYIKTVPKKGYRFTALVMKAGRTEAAPDRANKNGVDVAIPVLTATASRPASRRQIRILALALLVSIAALAGYLKYIRPPAKRSLAVLPLQNLRQDADSDFLGFSLADAVITKLGLLSSITVRPSSAVERYKGHSIDLKRAVAELKVDTLLTGNFIRDGGRLRITYLLVDARADKILTTDSIELEYDELLAVHDDVARQIVNGLQLKLSPAEVEHIKPDAPVNALAYEYYLRGVDLMGSHNFPLAVKMLEKSAEIDPKYALTWAYLGQSYTSDAAFELSGQGQYRRAQAAYERALALQPKQVEAEMFLANLLVDTGRVEHAVPLLRDALASNPNRADVHWELGYAYRFAGMLKKSVAESERARDRSDGAGQRRRAEHISVSRTVRRFSSQPPRGGRIGLFSLLSRFRRVPPGTF